MQMVTFYVYNKALKCEGSSSYDMGLYVRRCVHMLCYLTCSQELPLFDKLNPFADRQIIIFLKLHF